MGTTADAGPESQAGVLGIDGPRVTDWFAGHVRGSVPPLAFTLIAGGRSNLTFRVEDAAGHAYALRRPPVSHVLPTAHDMSREYRVMTALGATEVPVPGTFGLCTDEAVNGRPFYVMDFVEGHILRDAPTAEAALDPATRRVAAMNLADSLAALHAVDVDAVGLGDLGRHEGYIARQVKRWTGQYQEMAVPGVDHGGLVEQVAAELAATVPEQRGVSVVHGDYRLDNVVVDDLGQVAAVLDWEICTLGDPMADVGTLLCYWVEPTDDDRLLWTDPASVTEGFPNRQEVLARYAETSGRDVGEIAFYMAFGYWRLACILQGVYARYRAGAGAGDRNSVDEFPGVIGRLAERAATTLAAR
ncbi:MAG TPA: phosphotransferase family protein [Acidimicrobiales bacterium]|jgi:aminoglycoside phosphotransferase (APT) family kinase protein|nr:phosphotransferase family protein [Acidimicrobiales bacterium]